jgi:ABC-type polysaccharide/polyol phosphate transport system ATPase subunit
MSLAISVHNVSKLYRLGEISRGQLLADIHRWWTRRKARNAQKRDLPTEAEFGEKGDFWALKDISLEIKQGETVAIIGANGAGKSTLLKIISRITAPTAGLVRIRGRIGSLLEVGTGFHPELTGRDNVFLNGAILGMNRNEVKRKFDDIVGFAGLEQFIDTPVKRYSSGMYVRLAFSVAAFLEPEILIIDEVLSVGDQQFQSKCMQRIEEIVGDGRTLLFVSHGAGLIQRVCRRAVLLQHGKMIFDGDVDGALTAYSETAKQEAEDKHQQTPAKHEPPTQHPTSNEPASNEPASNTPASNTPASTAASNAPPNNELSSNEPSAQSTCFKGWPDLDTAPGDDVVRLEAVRVVDSQGCSVENLLTTQSASVEIEFVVLQGGKYLQPNLLFSDGSGIALFWSTDTNPVLRRKPMDKGEYKSSMLIPADFLAAGLISITVGIMQIAGEFTRHASVANALSFNVVDDFSEDSVRCGYKGPLPCLIRPRMKWTTERQDK